MLCEYTFLSKKATWVNQTKFKQNIENIFKRWDLLVWFSPIFKNTLKIVQTKKPWYNYTLKKQLILEGHFSSCEVWLIYSLIL